MPCDVVVVGAGPAGTLAATLLARAGARVQLFDRVRFPRPKLCGDTLNPGAIRVLAALVSTAEIERRALPLHGMLLSGPTVEVRGKYPHDLRAWSLTRESLDAMLLDQAIAAGVQFDDDTLVAAPLTGTPHGVVRGVIVQSKDGGRREHAARVVIAADGRESRLARAAGLARHPAKPRRWAIGGYFEGVEQLGELGEMHVRAGRYIGVAPVPGGLANACLVLPHHHRGVSWKEPAEMLTAAVKSDSRLGPRFARARLVAPPHVLGPLAVDVSAAGVPGMLLAGDAAGFIDPITGDGLHFALAGAHLAAAVATDLLAGHLDPASAVTTLASKRRQVFAAKWRFNRAIRALVSRPAAITAAGIAARVMPSAFVSVVRYAGDCR